MGKISGAPWVILLIACLGVINDVFRAGLGLVQRAYFRRWFQGISGPGSPAGTDNEDSINEVSSQCHADVLFYDRHFQTLSKNTFGFRDFWGVRPQ